MTREVNLEAIFDTLGEIHSRLIELEQTLREELETTAGPGKLGFSRLGREVSLDSSASGAGARNRRGVRPASREAHQLSVPAGRR
jgi:hypothetical protein